MILVLFEITKVEQTKFHRFLKSNKCNWFWNGTIKTWHFGKNIPTRILENAISKKSKIKTIEIKHSSINVNLVTLQILRKD